MGQGDFVGSLRKKIVWGRWAVNVLGTIWKTRNCLGNDRAGQDNVRKKNEQVQDVARVGEEFGAPEVAPGMTKTPQGFWGRLQSNRTHWSHPHFPQRLPKQHTFRLKKRRMVFMQFPFYR
ncbi:PREDICTED: uncharacterized protein LOC108536805 isoform X1 [Rhinopithecus bieti]|uniref:uncharacterized protein LOC108536805 isoform X1 n=1 Tax=Rhinopithecus bieti TaxID=61621 RepID=UPI00083C198A|nr:PREDICTED: uncharacterized protein LOC108536805 isoform X1 [Rhinopithecus bieti]